MNFIQWTKIPYGGETRMNANSFTYSSNSKCFFNKQKINSNPYHYNSLYLSVGYRSLDMTPTDYAGRLRTPEFICNENGEAIIEQKAAGGRAGEPMEGSSNQGHAYHL